MLKLKLQNFGHVIQRTSLLKRPSCWEGLKTDRERDNRGWDGWVASPTQWTWVWERSGSWWWTERPVMLQFMGLQRVGYDWATELNWSSDRNYWGKNTEMGCHALLQGIFPSQGSNPGLLHCSQILNWFEPPGKPLLLLAKLTKEQKLWYIWVWFDSAYFVLSQKLLQICC